MVMAIGSCRLASFFLVPSVDGSCAQLSVQLTTMRPHAHRDHAKPMIVFKLDGEQLNQQ
jgi:hypothetical protein